MRIHSAPSRETPSPEPVVSAGIRNKLVVLMPDGQFSFRLCSFSQVADAESFIVDGGILTQGSRWAAFWTHDAKPVRPDGSLEPAEAVVMFRESSQPEKVQIYSFVDMEAARDFLGTSVKKDRDLSLVLLYWVTPAALNVSHTAPEAEPAAPKDAAPLSRPPEVSPVRVAAPALQQVNGATEDSRPEPPLIAETEKRSPKRASLLSSVKGWPGWDGFAPRIVQAALLKEETYENVRRDPHAAGRAAVVVVAGAISAGIGAAGSGAVPGVAHVLTALVGWTVCVATVQFVGTRVFGGRLVSNRAVPQTIGLASVPALLLFLGVVPIFGPLFVLGAFIWMLVAMAVAAQYAFELDRESAIMTAALGWLLFFAIAQVAPTVLL